MNVQTVSTPPPAAPVPRPSSLDVFFAPEAVAVFGATEAPDSVGRAVMANLIRHPFGGVLLPISPSRWSVLGVKACRCLEDAAMPVDLAVVATPAPMVPGVIAECRAAGVRGAIILSSGFQVCDQDGTDLRRQLREELRLGEMRILGPNCIGVVSARTGLNATFAPTMIRPGHIGFISQCGSLLTALTSGSPAERLGCSNFISVGSMLDVGWADCLGYLEEDPCTESIGVYLETIVDVPSFIAAARKVTARKPVVVLKSRRTDGNDRPGGPLDEAFSRAGVLRVPTLADLFRMTELLAGQPTPRGRRLMVVSNAAGPAGLAADALLADGGELAPPGPAIVAVLDRLLPGHGRRKNPIVIGDDASLSLFAETVAAAARDPNCDAVLAILAPQAMIDPVLAAEQLVGVAKETSKPFLACWLWGAANPQSLAILQTAEIPALACPDLAARAFGYLWRHGANLRGKSN